MLDQTNWNRICSSAVQMKVNVVQKMGPVSILTLFLVLAASVTFADEKLRTLQIAGITYSNVSVFKVSATDIYFTSDKGLANVKLKNLDPALQRHFNYNPTNAAVIEQGRAVADARYRGALAKGVSARSDVGPITSATISGVDVFLIPMDDFNAELAGALASSLSRDLGIRISATRKVTIQGLAPFPGTTQYSADDILDTAEDAVQRLPGSLTNTAYIILTQRDINLNDRKLRFCFASHNYNTRVSVVSSARMSGPWNGKSANLETVTARIKKMVKRSIGLEYFGYRHSADIHDLMFAPIMSLNDLDRISDDFSRPVRGL